MRFMWLGLWLCACAAPSQAPAEVASPVPPMARPSSPGVADTNAAPGAERHLEGLLTHTPIEDRKSVESYLGVEFSLDLGGEVVVLGASDTVSREALAARKGQRVKVVCTMREGAVPRPDESYPMEADGSPMKRPPVCVVSALE